MNASSFVEKLKRAQRRRHERKTHTFDIYAYFDFSEGAYASNLMQLPVDMTLDDVRGYFVNALLRLVDIDLDYLRRLEVRRIGRWCTTDRNIKLNRNDVVILSRDALSEIINFAESKKDKKHENK